MTNLFRKIKWLILIGGDILILYLALWFTLKVRYGARFDIEIWQQHLFPFTVLYLTWLIIFYILGLYDLKLAKNNLAFYVALLKSLGICALLGLSFFYLIPYFGINPKTNFFLNLILFLTLFSFWRQTYNFFIKYPLLSNNIIIVGKNPQTLELVEKINSNPQLGYRVISLVNPKKEKLLNLKLNHNVHTIITAIDLHKYPGFTRALYHHLPLFNFGDFPSFYAEVTGKIPLPQINEIWFLGNLKEQEREFYEILKRLIDVFIGLVLGIVMVLLLPFIALAIKSDSPGPIFYQQKRVGKNRKIFNLIKFRSMKKGAEKEGKVVWAQKNDLRITRVGKIIRKTLIDELPQCINILNGDLSFIGPRPERPEFVKNLEKQVPFYQIRHIIKPGLTGWAQVNFPYGKSVEDALEKLQYELYYIKNRSLILDLKIILKTVNVVLKGGTL